MRAASNPRPDRLASLTLAALLIVGVGSAVTSAQAGVSGPATPSTGATDSVSRADLAPHVGIWTPALAVDGPNTPGPQTPRGNVLHCNGSYITGFGNGFNGANTSALEFNHTGIGFTANPLSSPPYRIADDVTVPAGQSWAVSQIRWLAYQVNSPTSGTITSMRVQIWNGPPGAPGAVVIHGDPNTNRLTGQVWTGVYRYVSSPLENTRPIMECTASVPGWVLPGGATYWIDVTFTGSLGVNNGPFCPPTVPSDQAGPNTDNARQSVTGVWGPCLDGGDDRPAEFPFCVDGDVVAPPANDHCNTAAPIAIGESVVGNTTLAMPDPNAPPCGTTISAPGVWYTLTGHGTTLTASTCDPATSFDTRINIYCGRCTCLTCIDGNDNAGGGCVAMGGSTVSWCAAPGSVYRILVQGTNGAVGQFRLSITDSGMPCVPTVSCAEATVCCKGDANLSGLVDGDDIQPFVSALALAPGCNERTFCPVDMNGDDRVDSLDLPLFVARLLVKQSCPP